MGAYQSVGNLDDDDQESESDEEEEEEEDEEYREEEDEDQINHGEPGRGERKPDQVVKKILEQEPEMLPCHASASPLSPQLSSFGTPRLGPSIKVWDPFNVLAPPRPAMAPPPVFPRNRSVEDDRAVLEVYLISHGECELSLRPDLVGGRCPAAALTADGNRQARALAVFLNSQGIRFDAVYCSPLERARSMAISVCQEMNFAEEQIRPTDALMEISMGHWEGLPHSEVYTPEILDLIERYQPDFAAPSGESARHVEFRMLHFLSETVIGLPEKLRLDISAHTQKESEGFSHQNSHIPNSVHGDGSSLPPPHWEMHQRNRHGAPKKKSAKSRLQVVTSFGDQDADDEMSPRVPIRQTDLPKFGVKTTPPSSQMSTYIGIFTHSFPIKCAITGLLGCNAVTSHKLCIDDSSVSVLQHSWKTGWQLKSLNDTAHLRLL